jgi:hypothetical protein
VFKLGGILEVPIMWMDIVIKSPGKNTPENKAKFKKMATGLRASAIIVGLSIILLFVTGNTALAAGIILLVLFINMGVYFVSSRRLAVMISNNFFELGYNPSDEKFKSSADRSGHNAAKNILIVANKLLATSAFFVVCLVAYIIFNRTPESGSGLISFIFIHAFIADLAVYQNIFRGYVRLGARKKLKAAGFMGGGSKVTTTTGNTTIGTR